MQELKCKNCGHFHQHYALNGRELHWVYCGHCSVPKIRIKKPDEKICQYFIPGKPDEDAFVRKEYLGKELLKYLMELELLPEIQKPAK